MKNQKRQTLVIRITEGQFRRLNSILIEEQKTKSNLLREIINEFVQGNCRKNLSNNGKGEITNNLR